MSETGIKVYELAKELGTDSISLLDKLKSLNINVKNHMSELRPEEAEMARSSLTHKGATAGKKATAPKKTAAAKTATAAKATTARTRKAGAPAPAPEPAEAPAAEKKAASPIIRRRVKADGVTETVSHAPGATARPEAPGELEHPEYQA